MLNHPRFCAAKDTLRALHSPLDLCGRGGNSASRSGDHFCRGGRAPWTCNGDFPACRVGSPSGRYRQGAIGSAGRSFHRRPLRNRGNRNIAVCRARSLRVVNPGNAAAAGPLRTAAASWGCLPASCPRVWPRAVGAYRRRGSEVHRPLRVRERVIRASGQRGVALRRPDDFFRR